MFCRSILDENNENTHAIQRQTTVCLKTFSHLSFCVIIVANKLAYVLHIIRQKMFSCGRMTVEAALKKAAQSSLAPFPAHDHTTERCGVGDKKRIFVSQCIVEPMYGYLSIT